MHIHLKPENNEIGNLYKHHSTYHEGDCGFDLFTVEDLNIEPGKKSYIIDLKVSCEAFKSKEEKDENISYCLYLRSSTASKTSLRLANSVGIIDSGYRGTLKAIVDNIDTEKPVIVPKKSRLFQLCSPHLSNVTFEVVDGLSETSRGSGGLGSTGN
jgi:dUTP pyrophosphatase|tara:strand:+ start:437 stop:904 length:468 start_codon:yes stop_codon:yes gene_type:complete